MILASILLAATPLFVTPEMTYRRGLTDEQYKLLWSMGRTPQVDQATARDWVFKSSRYSNVTNWLNIVGKTNDFAKLSLTLQEENFVLEATNAVVTASNSVLRTELRAETIKYNTASNQLVIAEGQLNAANAKIQDEIDWLNQTYPNVSLMARDCTDKAVKSYLQNGLVPAMTNRIAILRSVLLTD